MKTGIYIEIKDVGEYDFDEGLAETLKTHTNTHTAFEETVIQLINLIREDMMEWYYREVVCK